MSNSKDFIVKNAVEVGGATKVTVGDAATGGSRTAGYNTVDNWAYDSVSFSVSSQSTDPYGVAFKSDGTKMYIAELSGDRIYQYSLSTAYDISTASYDSVSLNTSSQDNPVDVIFKPDGTKLYICGSNNSNIYQYSLSTAWDLSTASYDSVTFSTSSQDAYPYGITFNSDGTKIFLVGNQNNRLYQYSLSTAYDISTMSYTSQFFSFASQDTATTGISFNSNGTKMYAVGFTTDTIYQYSLSTAYDVTSISYDSLSFSVSSQDSQPWSIVFNSDGSKGYVVGHATDTIYQYSTGSTVTTGSFDLSTGNYFTDTPSADVEYTFSNAGDVQSFQLEVTGNQSVVGYDLANASYDNVASTALTASNKSLFISPDGLNLYTTTSQTVQQHTMTTAWDLSTLPATASKTFSVSSQESGPEELFFKPDGTKMYVVGETNDTVFQYSLSTAWDVSTASYDSKSFAVDPSNPRACWFKPDGTRLFTCGPVSDKIFSYDLSTAWDVSTASSASKVEVSIASYSAALNSFAMSDDGTKIFIGSNATPSDTIVQLDLTTAWDLSTLTSNSISFSYASQEDQINGLFFKDDGTKMYIGGQITSTSIYQYSTASSTAITVTWDADIAWPSGTAPDSPAAGEKDIYTFTTDDGGTTYIGVQSGDAFS